MEKIFNFFQLIFSSLRSPQYTAGKIILLCVHLIIKQPNMRDVWLRKFLIFKVSPTVELFLMHSQQELFFTCKREKNNFIRFSDFSSRSSQLGTVPKSYHTLHFPDKNSSPTFLRTSNCNFLASPFLIHN